MLRLRTLGALDLRGADERPLAAVGQQPKRLALLAYLALATPRGPHRRDTLLALLWPEASDARARNALSQALHHLRRALGDGVLVGRGADAVELDRAALWCDAAAFEDALAAGDSEGALALYQGPLLPGFFVSDAPEFERWLDEARARVEAAAVAAARTLAERAAAAGDAATAAHWAQRTLAIRPDDEGGVRRAVALLARAGDRAGALAAYDAFARRLRAAYDAEPAAETAALAAALRRAPPSPDRVASDAVSNVPAAVAGEAGGAESARAAPPADPTDALPAPATSTPDPSTPDPSELDVAVTTAPAQDSTVGTAPTGVAPAGPNPESAATPALPPGQARRLGRRAGRLVALGGAVLCVVAAVWRWREAGAPSGVTAAPGRVAVLPFAYYGDPRYGYLGTGLVSLLSTGLDGAGDLRSVDPRAVVSVAAQGPPRAAGRGSGLGPADARSVARRFGAELYVLGEVVEVAGRLRLAATLYQDRPGGPVRLGQADVETDEPGLFAAVDQLTARLLAARGVGPGERLARVAAVTTHALPALKAYLTGDTRYREGRYAEAVDAFRAAAALDPTFALAHYRLSVASTWVGDDALTKPALAQAMAFRGRLSPRDRALVEAWASYVWGPGEVAGERYRAVLAGYPDDVEARYQLGEVLFHWLPPLGSPVARAAPEFRRVLTYEPDHAGALAHLARLAATAGRVAELDTLADRLVRLAGGEDRAAEAVALRAFMARPAAGGDSAGDAAARRRVLARAAGADAPAVLRLARAVAVHAEHLAGAEALTAALVEPGRDVLTRARARVLRAQLAAARGRWGAAQREVAALAPLQPAWAAQAQVAAALAVPGVPRADLDAARGALAGAAATYAMPAESLLPDSAPRPLYAPRRLYLLGRVAGRLGDPGAAAGYADSLERVRDTPRNIARSRDYAEVLRAWLAWDRGDARGALAALGPPRLSPDSLLPTPESFAEADGRFLRAEALRTLGRAAEADSWYATVADPSGDDLVYLAPSHRRRAEIRAARGDAAGAAAHAARAAALWADADPPARAAAAAVWARSPHRGAGPLAAR